MSNAGQSQKLNQYLEVAHRAADRASQILLSYFDNLEWIGEKDQAGLVTEADQKSENIIKQTLLESYPEHEFLGEETGRHGGAEHDSRFLWIVDPLDGTTNFVHSFPLFCISIALEIEGQLQVAVIDAPVLKMRWTALCSQGAFLNGKKISVSQRKTLNESLFATGFSSQDKVEISSQVSIVEKVLNKTRGIRRAGAAALDLCFVAQGVFDGFWETRLNAWDTAAGALLVKEAGGVVQSFESKNYDPRMSSIIASTPLMMGQLRSLLELQDPI